MEYSSLRLNLSQSFNGIGKVVGPLIASDTFFRSGNGDNLTSVQYVCHPQNFANDTTRYTWEWPFSSGVWRLSFILPKSLKFPMRCYNIYKKIRTTVCGMTKSRYNVNTAFLLPYLRNLCMSALRVRPLLNTSNLKVTIATFFVNYANEVAGFSDAKAATLLSVAQGV